MMPIVSPLHDPLSESRLRLTILFPFDLLPEQLLEETAPHQAIDDAVVDHAAEVERLHPGADLRIGLLIDDRLDRAGQHVRYAFECAGSGVEVVDAFHVRLLLS